MTQVEIELPDTFLFATEVAVRITDINYGNHLGNDAYFGLLHEARMRWLHQYGWTELDIDGIGLIMVDVAMKFQAEVQFADRLRIELAVSDVTHCGFLLTYRLTNIATGKDVAMARTRMVCFNYTSRKIAPIPPALAARLTS